MLQAGDVLNNPANNERIMFLTTASESFGRFSRFEAWFGASGGVATPHAHPRQEEAITVLKGQAQFVMGDQTMTLKAGESVVIPAGVLHRFANTGEGELHVLTELHPALRSDEMMTVASRLTQQGKIGGSPLTTMLHGALLVTEYRDEFALPQPAQWAAQWIIAPIARRLGVKLSYRTETRRITASQADMKAARP